jgi:hypothetical protein
MRFICRIVSIVSSLWIQSLWASGAPGSHWSTIIDKLQQSGISQIGDFNVAAFRAIAEAIDWTSISGAPLLIQSGSRQSATYRCGNKQIQVSRQLPSEAESSLPQMELHEALGRACWDDHDYSLSTALMILANMSDSPQRQALLKEYASTLFRGPIRIAKARMGGTSVSGGGDLATLYIKDQVLKNIMGDNENRSAATAEFLLEYARIDFEPVHSMRATEVSVEYEFIARTRSEKISVFIPMRIWNQGGGGRDLLIRETTHKVLALFPAYSGTEVRTFQPKRCASAGQVVTYPLTNDAAMFEIQNERGAVQLGCWKFGQGWDFVKILAPALAPSEMPKEANNYYFACQFRHGSATLDVEFTEPAAENGNHLFGKPWSIEGNDYLDGSVIVSHGRILGTLISYSPPHTDIPTHFMSPKSGPDHSSVKTMINGQELSFTCHTKR